MSVRAHDCRRAAGFRLASKCQATQSARYPFVVTDNGAGGTAELEPAVAEGVGRAERDGDVGTEQAGALPLKLAWHRKVAVRFDVVLLVVVIVAALVPLGVWHPPIGIVALGVKDGLPFAVVAATIWSIQRRTGVLSLGQLGALGFAPVGFARLSGHGFALAAVAAIVAAAAGSLVLGGLASRVAGDLEASIVTLAAGAGLSIVAAHITVRRAARLPVPFHARLHLFPVVLQGADLLVIAVAVMVFVGLGAADGRQEAPVRSSRPMFWWTFLGAIGGLVMVLYVDGRGVSTGGPLAGTDSVVALLAAIAATRLRRTGLLIALSVPVAGALVEGAGFFRRGTGDVTSWVSGAAVLLVLAAFVAPELPDERVGAPPRDGNAVEDPTPAFDSPYLAD